MAGRRHDTSHDGRNQVGPRGELRDGVELRQHQDQILPNPNFDRAAST